MGQLLYAYWTFTYRRSKDEQVAQEFHYYSGTQVCSFVLLVLGEKTAMYRKHWNAIQQDNFGLLSCLNLGMGGWTLKSLQCKK